MSDRRRGRKGEVGGGSLTGYAVLAGPSGIPRLAAALLLAAVVSAEVLAGFGVLVAVLDPAPPRDVFFYENTFRKIWPGGTHGPRNTSRTPVSHSFWPSLGGSPGSGMACDARISRPTAIPSDSQTRSRCAACSTCRQP